MKIDRNKLEEMCVHISERELVASKAERDSIKYKQAEYLLDKIGKEFEGIISGISDWGLYVELIDSKCEGMIRYGSLDGTWNVDTTQYVITSDSGEKIRLGDKITIVVSSVNLDKKQIDFIKL